MAVGEWVTKRYAKGGTVSQVQKHGMRVVCTVCACRIDAVPRIRELRQWIIIGLLLIGLVAISFFGLVASGS